MANQRIIPNPSISCKPGLCLDYVRETYGLDTKHLTAAANWNASDHKHTDQNFPDDIWVPIWFTVPGDPDGHVALRQPDGSIWSSTNSKGTTPVHLPSIQDLISYYHGRLSYLGWTEDLEGELIMHDSEVVVSVSSAESSGSGIESLFGISTTVALPAAVLPVAAQTSQSPRTTIKTNNYSIMATQLITPNPNIPCTPGMCLVYVRETYGIGPKYPTATAGWMASTHQHTDQIFPENMWVPLWFSLNDNPDGHVVLRQPDGSIWSASSPTATTPVHHLSLAKLESYYGNRLTYLGWTEDLEGESVIEATEQPKK